MISKNSKAELKFQKVMHEFGQGKLTSHGEKVTDNKQALAIAFSEARKINPNYGISMVTGGEIDTGDVVTIEGKEGAYHVVNVDQEEQTAKVKKIGEMHLQTYSAPLSKMTIIQKWYKDGGKLDSIYRTGTVKQLWDAWDRNQRLHFIIDHTGKQHTPVTQEKLTVTSYNFLPKDIKKEIAIHHAMGIYHEGSKIEDKKYVIRVGEIYDHSRGKALVKRTYEEDGIPMVDYEFSNDKITKPETQTLKGFIATIQDEYAGGTKIEVKISPAMKKIQERILRLKSSLENVKSESAKNAIQKKIDKLQKEFDYKPTAKELARENKGKFALDVPKTYSKRVYKKLWSMNVLPRIMNMNGTSSIMVTNQTNLMKAYKVYSDILNEEGKEVPSMKKISRKL